MKTLILVLAAALLVGSPALAIERISAEVPACRDGADRTPTQCETPTSRPVGIDLSRVPVHLRYLVLFAWMRTYQSVVFP